VLKHVHVVNGMHYFSIKKKIKDQTMVPVHRYPGTGTKYKFICNRR